MGLEFAGRSVGFGVGARTPATRLLLRWKEPPVPRARPSEVPRGLLGRGEWNHVGLELTRRAGLYPGLYQTPAFAGKDRSWPPRSIAVSRRPAVRKRHLQPQA